MNSPSLTAESQGSSRQLLHNAVAITALIHRSPDYPAFYRTVPGLPGIWNLCIVAAEEFTKQELRIRSQEETDNTYSFDWLDGIEKYVEAILKLQKEELDRLQLERLAHRAVWGVYGDQCPLKCSACQPSLLAL